MIDHVNILNVEKSMLRGDIKNSPDIFILLILKRYFFFRILV